jgi:hypothetical protein
MQHIKLPVGFVHYKTDKTIKGILRVAVPRYQILKEFELELIPQDIADSALAFPQIELSLDVQASKVPYVIEFNFIGTDLYLNCILFQPRIDVKFNDVNYKNEGITNASVRTMNLKQNDQEISKEITNLDPGFNFRSWVNAHLKTGDHLLYRLHVDLKYDQSCKKKLNML